MELKDKPDEGSTLLAENEGPYEKDGVTYSSMRRGEVVQLWEKDGVEYLVVRKR